MNIREAVVDFAVKDYGLVLTEEQVIEIAGIAQVDCDQAIKDDIETWVLLRQIDGLPVVYAEEVA